MSNWLRPTHARLQGFRVTGHEANDDTAAFQSAAASIPAGKTIEIPPGRYRVSSPITIGLVKFKVDRGVLIGDMGGRILPTLVITDCDTRITGMQSVEYRDPVSNRSTYSTPSTVVVLTRSAARWFPPDSGQV